MGPGPRFIPLLKCHYPSSHRYLSVPGNYSDYNPEIINAAQVLRPWRHVLLHFRPQTTLLCPDAPHPPPPPELTRLLCFQVASPSLWPCMTTKLERQTISPLKKGTASRSSTIREYPPSAGMTPHLLGMKKSAYNTFPHAGFLHSAAGLLFHSWQRCRLRLRHYDAD